jgi:protein SCO1/2
MSTLLLLLAMQQVDIDERLGARVPAQLAFTDSDGRAVHLGDYFGKPVLLTLAYFRCPMLCDLVLRGVAEAVKDLDVHALTVSIDPKDRPAAASLKQHSLLQAINRPRADWPFLVGEPAQIAQLARAVGFGYSYDEKTDQYAHPAVAIILTADGRISRYLYGFQFRTLDVRLALADAANGRTGGIVDRVLLTCFRYDPATRRYAWAVRGALRLSALLTLAALAIGFALLRRRRLA